MLPKAVIMGTFLLGLISSPVFSEQILDCDDPKTQSKMNECAFLYFQEADSALNRIWPKAKARMEEINISAPDDFKGGPEKLLRAQRAWIKFRDAHCEAESLKFAGGSIMPLILHSCKENLTRERIKHLQSLINEG